MKARARLTANENALAAVGILAMAAWPTVRAADEAHTVLGK